MLPQAQYLKHHLKNQVAQIFKTTLNSQLDDTKYFSENSEEQGPEKRAERRQSIDMPTVEDSDKKDTIEKLDDSKKAESGDDASVVSGDLGIGSFIHIGTNILRI